MTIEPIEPTNGVKRMKFEEYYCFCSFLENYVFFLFVEISVIQYRSTLNVFAQHTKKTFFEEITFNEGVTTATVSRGHLRLPPSEIDLQPISPTQSRNLLTTCHNYFILHSARIIIKISEL